MSDQDILMKYRKYKRKKRIFLFSFIPALFFLVVFFRNNGIRSPDPVVQIKDKVPPIIQLTSDKIEVQKGDTLNYMDFVKNVYDDIDGNLTDKISYDTISTENVGEFNVVYHVKDSSNNITKAVLIVTVKEPKNSYTSSNDEENIISESKSPPRFENSSTTESFNKERTEIIENKKVVKDFLFSDGYTMMNVSSVCASELKRIGRAGICTPIQDEMGIYLGMRLETD